MPGLPQRQGQDALRGGASGRSVAIEFGSLLVFGLIVALLMFQR